MCTTVETLEWRNESTQVDQYVHFESMKRVSSEIEPEKYWVDRMSNSSHKIIPNNKFNRYQI